TWVLEEGGPGTSVITTVVTDFNPWAINAQHLSDTNSFTVTVLPAGMSLVIQAITFTNGAATITWRSSVGHVYRLQFKGDLSDANWSDSAPNIIATGNSITATNACGAFQARFYRVLQVQ